MLHHITIYTAFVVLTLLPLGKKNNVAVDADKQTKTSVAWTASWSYNDSFVAIGNDNGELAIYETTGWSKIKSWQYDAATITRVEWNPKHPVLAVASVWHQGKPAVVQLYDVANDKVVKTLHDTLRGRCVSWSPGGEEVAFTGAGGKISIFTKEGALRKTLSYTNPNTLMDIDWHPLKNLLLVVEEDIYLLDIDSDSLLATYNDGSKNKGILCCQWHPSGNLFVTGDYGHENEGGEPSYLKYWSFGGGLLQRIKESKAEYRNVKWSRDGKRLAAAGDALLVFDQKGEVLNKIRFDGNNLWGVEWSNSGDRIICTDQAGNIRVTDSTGKVLMMFTQ